MTWFFQRPGTTILKVPMSKIGIGVLIVGLLGCTKMSKAPQEQIDASFVKIGEDSLAIREGRIGFGNSMRTASYVVVSVENTYGKKIAVTLGGSLLGPAGEILSELKPEFLVIPSGKIRVFALPTRATRPFANATSAKIELISARESEMVSRIKITEANIFNERDRITLKAYVENHTDSEVKVMVFGAFYDDKGKPVDRPALFVQIPAQEKKLVQFEGAKRSVRGQIYLGQMAF